MLPVFQRRKKLCLRTTFYDGFTFDGKQQEAADIFFEHRIDENGNERRALIKPDNHA